MSEELVPGMLVGNYRLLFRLGKGGMGEVWAAANSKQELGFQKLIALKVLRTKELTSNAAVMFLDEAKAASVLVHAAIVPTVDLGQDGDILFLAMDMVRGPSLTALLQKLVINKAVMSPAIVAHIGVQIASALDYAHDRATFQGKALKLIHRDVSPHNVLLDLHGAVRLTDFGVARTTIQNHESHVGTVRGKPSYMAPEQVVGGDIDARTDLFSLGIVLYESASLKRLFGRSNPVKSMDAVLKHQPKPLPELVPGFPTTLWAVIEKALAKDPEKRFQHAAELAEALTEAGRTLPGAASAQRDLVTLITESFPPEAFEIDGRVREAMATAGAIEHAAITGSDVSLRAPAGRGENATRAMRARSASRVREPEVYVADAYGTQAVWPSTSAPDPLAPEAIEEARTKFAARTPSGIQAMNMAFMPTAPSADAMPAFTGVITTGVSFPVAQRRRSNTLLITSLAFAALVLLGTAFVVVSRNKEPAAVPAQALGDVPPTETAPGVIAKQNPGVEQKKSAVVPVEAPVQEVKREEPTEATVPAADKAAKKTPSTQAAATTAKRTPTGPTPEEQAAAEAKKAAQTAAASGDANATRAEVLALIRRVKLVDPDAAKEMYPTLNEAGDDNVKVLNELRARAKSILTAPR